MPAALLHHPATLLAGWYLTVVLLAVVAGTLANQSNTDKQKQKQNQNQKQHQKHTVLLLRGVFLVLGLLIAVVLPRALPAPLCAVYGLAGVTHLLRAVLLAATRVGRGRSPRWHVGYVQCFQDLTQAQTQRAGAWHRLWADDALASSAAAPLFAAAVYLSRTAHWLAAALSSSSTVTSNSIVSLLMLGVSGPMWVGCAALAQVCALLHAWAALHAVDALYRGLALLLGGVELPPVMAATVLPFPLPPGIEIPPALLRFFGVSPDSMVRARTAKCNTLAAFWRGWNRAGVQTLLNDAVYRPLVPRWGRPGAAMATFAASGLLHAYPLLLLGHGWHAALRMALFFVAQGVLIAAEAVLPTVLHGPVWVTTALCATLPLATSAVLA